MPELPELEVIAEILTRELHDEPILGVIVHNHLVVYSPIDQMTSEMRGRRVKGFGADGKFLILDTGSLELIVNPMLTGRFSLSNRGREPSASDSLSLEFKEKTLWYSDTKHMGRVYLVRDHDYSAVAEFLGRGPSALDSSLTMAQFKTRIRRHRGQIKNVLRNQRFVKGIGNAYADEILLYAGVLPFRRRETMSEKETEAIYEAMRKLLPRYIEILRKRALKDIGSDKRDFLMVHGKGGSICPLCGGRVSEVTANRFKTNYCQSCQS